jgi:KDO2-lipid IV(A) lauroyltransferase
MAEFILGNSLRKLARANRPLQQLLWRVDFAMLWLLVKLFTLLPVDTASRLGERVGAWIGPRLKRKSMIFKENMAIAFPDLEDAELDALVRRAWGRAGRILAEYPHLETILNEPGRLEIDIREEIETYRDPSRPCVVVSAHQSNWEIAASALAKLGIPNASLYSPPTNPLLDRMLQESRRALNCELLPRDNSTRLLVRALKGGRSVGIVMDRRVDDGRPVPFFGRDKLSTIMPAWLALKYGCDLVPLKVERLQDARYRATLYAPVRPADPAADLSGQAIDMTRQLHQQFERWIRENPQDWFCSKRLWPKGKIGDQQQTPQDVEGEKHAA